MNPLPHNHHRFRAFREQLLNYSSTARSHKRTFGNKKKNPLQSLALFNLMKNVISYLINEPKSTYALLNKEMTVKALGDRRAQGQPGHMVTLH